MNALKTYFAKPDLPHPPSAVIDWWETRRLLYNLILFAEMVLVSIAYVTIGPGAPPAWHPFGHAFTEVIVNSAQHIGIRVFLLLLPANFWYTGAWIFEIILRSFKPTLPGRFAPIAFIAGIVFSVAFVGIFSMF